MLRLKPTKFLLAITMVFYTLNFGVVPAKDLDTQTLDCTGKFKGGVRPSYEEFDKTLKEHWEWIESGGARGNVANFCQANLSKWRLKGMYLTEANLEEADLTEANLEEANLTEANLFVANLTKVRLPFANLTKADLAAADLTEANLYKANLTEASLGGANFNRTNWDIHTKTLPFIQHLTYNENLSKISYSETPHALVELRSAFKQSGMRTQEREITYALEHTKRLKKEEKAKNSDGEIIDWRTYLEARSNYFLFEFSSDWGMSPGKPLQFILMLIPGFGLLYMMAVDPHPHVKESGIWKVFPEDNPLKIKGKDRYQRVEASSLFTILLWGIYVSILSTFHIGWRDLNVGTWISRLQPQAFTIQAVGWVRVVSGVQSLISVYLLALSVLTYFGRPFD